MNKKPVIIAAAASAAAACAVLFYVLRGEGGRDAEPAAAGAAEKAGAADGKSGPSAPVATPRAAKPRPRPAPKARAPGKTRSAPAGAAEKPRLAMRAPELSPEERKAVAAVQDALDKEDRAATFELARKLASDKSPAVRAKVVEALGWFGKNAMPELVPFIGDADEDVANDAMSYFEQAIGELDDDLEIAQTLIAAMKAVNDPEALESLASHFYHIDEGIAVEALIEIMSAGGAAAEAGKEAYSFASGEDWTGVQAAQDWLNRHRAEAAAEEAAAKAAPVLTPAPAAPDGGAAPAAPGM